MTTASSCPRCKRLDRAREIAATPDMIQRRPDGRYLVASATQPGLWHIAQMDPAACSCAAFRFSGQPCKHLFAILFARAGKSRAAARQIGPTNAVATSSTG
jgi:hypothetical protein